MTISPGAFLIGLGMFLPCRRVFQWQAAKGISPTPRFTVGDVHAKHTLLSAGAFVLPEPPTVMGPVTIAAFDDTPRPYPNRPATLTDLLETSLIEAGQADTVPL